MAEIITKELMKEEIPEKSIASKDIYLDTRLLGHGNERINLLIGNKNIRLYYNSNV